MTTPTVSNVTGAITTGQELTISGLNLEDYLKTNWDTAVSSGEDSFEGTYGTGFPTSDGWSYEGGDYDTNVFLSGSQSFHWSGSGNGIKGGAFYNDNLSQTNQGFFVRFYLRMDFTTNGDGRFANSSDKIIRWNGEGEDFLFNFQTEGNGNPALGGAVYDNVLLDLSTGGWESPGPIPGGAIIQNEWYCFEVEIPGGSPWNWRVWINGRPVTGYNPIAGSGNPNQSMWDTIFESNTHGSETGYETFGFDKWQDLFAISTSRIYDAGMVEIGDNSDYASANLNYCFKRRLSDTEIKARCDVTGLGAEPYYLWVTNGQGQRSLAYELGAGPASPSNRWHTRRSNPTAVGRLKAAG